MLWVLLIALMVLKIFKMKKIIFLVIALVVIGFVFFTIKSKSSIPTQSNSSTIYEQAWKLVKIDERDQKDIKLTEQKNITDSFVINFSDATGQFNGHAFCKSYSGDYNIEDNGKISFKNISSGLDKTDCGKSGNDEELKYFNTLSVMTQYEMTSDTSGKTLHLKNANTTMYFSPFQ